MCHVTYFTHMLLSITYIIGGVNSPTYKLKRSDLNIYIFSRFFIRFKNFSNISSFPFKFSILIINLMYVINLCIKYAIINNKVLNAHQTGFILL